MNQTEMAERLDVSVSTVSRLVSGERRPSLDLMIKIRDELGWPLDNQADLLNVGMATWSSQFWRRVEAHGDSGH
jgi:transcriptional regulator with XRE-family HTH domain